ENKFEEEGFVFLGLVGMMDPPRPEAYEAVKKAREAGIRTVMVTGDHRLTALAVAKEVGIYREGDLVLTGEEVERLSDEEFDRIVERVVVYARI
ncbi:MAG: HAD family hydrolase, partial [Crenarchaeota archaeon]|nr:HAD family hydrolase [Thermoproteota archaeon]MDW8034819.1 HAD family hydrolase [Nitrososphaerota archaeon]